MAPERSALIHRIKKDSNVKIVPYSKWSGVSLKTAMLLKQTVVANNIDIIHVHDSHSHTFSVIANLFKCDTPIVVTRRVDFKLKNWSKLKYNFKGVKKIVSISERVKEILIKGGVRRSKIQTIYSAVDLKKEKSSSAQSIRKILDLPERTRIIGFIGAMVVHKNPLMFVKLCLHILKEGKISDVHFLMIGEKGELSNVVKKRIRDFNLTKFISCLGFVGDMDMVWKDLDLLAVTSNEEGLGTVILEAFMRQIPVVATDVGGISELVENQKTGMLVPKEDYIAMSDRIITILEHPALMKTITANACDFVEKFDIMNMASSYHKLYLSILTNK
jgi:glycosyltransferase involved in cell wall biosynthesis